MKVPYIKAAAFAACCVLKLNAALAAEGGAVDTTAESELIASVREELSATNTCSAIEDSLGCKVDDFCQCNGKAYDGCTQCYYGSACHMITAKASICMPLPKDEIKSHKTGTNCVVDDYEQCGGTDYEDCQRCKPGSTCTEQIEGDESFLICVPKKDVNRMKGKPGLDDEKILKVAKLMSGVDEQLDKDVDDENKSIEEIGLDEMHALATEKGLERLNHLAKIHDPDYEEVEAEAEESADEYCALVSHPGSMVSQETRDCICKLTAPLLHCVAKLGVEFEQHLDKRRALGEYEEDGNPLSLEDVFDPEDLRKIISEGTRKVTEEEALEDALKNVKDTLEQSPEIDGDVEELLAEAWDAAEEALRKVYESDKYDFSEFGEEDHPIERSLRGERDLKGVCDLGIFEKNSKKKKGSTFERIWGYANAMIKFIEEGQGCIGASCTLQLPKVPLSVSLAVSACVGAIPPLSSYTYRSGTQLHAALSRTTVSLSASLCLTTRSRLLKEFMDFFRISMCFLNGGFTIYPLLGKFDAHITFGGPLQAKLSFAMLYDDFPTKKTGVCHHHSLKSNVECRLCEGGFTSQFEIKVDYMAWNSVLLRAGPWEDKKCSGGHKLSYPKDSALKKKEEELEKERKRKEAERQKTNQMWGSALRRKHEEAEAGKVSCGTEKKDSCSQCRDGYCGGDCWVESKYGYGKAGECVKKPSYKKNYYRCNYNMQNVEYCKLCKDRHCNVGYRSKDTCHPGRYECTN